MRARRVVRGLQRSSLGQETGGDGDSGGEGEGRVGTGNGVSSEQGHWETDMGKKPHWMWCLRWPVETFCSNTEETEAVGVD